ncbi:MAG: hypothetical protein RMM53_06475 [Bacteroidia bacterium]|nr:hypothetical protein [Bacteroidia bacterium]MDW8333842.1 hypothetical protein [Bacteroidia bacterium]
MMSKERLNALSNREMFEAIADVVGSYALEECKGLREQAFQEGRDEALSLVVPYMRSLNIADEVIAAKLRLTDAEYAKHIEA